MDVRYKQNELFDGHFRLIRPLSTAGGTADVWLAADLNTVDDPISDENPDESTAMKVALKIYRPQNALDIEGAQRFRDEFKIVFNCHHANLIPPTQFGITGETPYLVMPYCSRGSSETLIGKLRNNESIWQYVHDVAAGLAYLHGLHPPIVHQDIKPANVLIDDSGNYAITDFGISATRDHHQAFDENKGTLAYMAPERFLDDTPQAESDIYAFGVTLYEVLTGQVPFGEEGGKAQAHDPVNLDYFNNPVPADIKRLVVACLTRDPSHRPTAQQIVKAAASRQFPLRGRGNSQRWLYATALIGVLVALVAGASLIFKNKSQSASGTLLASEAISIDTVAIFTRAVDMAQSSDRHTVENGMKSLDSIADAFSYIPAYYEISRTYGIRFSIDETTYGNRRSILGVTLGKNPTAKSDVAKFATRIVNLFDDIPDDNTHIKIANDACQVIITALSAKPNLKADELEQLKISLWSSSIYNALIYKDYQRAKKDLVQCHGLAVKTNDAKFVSLTEEFLSTLNPVFNR